MSGAGFASAQRLPTDSHLTAGQRVRFTVPASTANLGPGFDSIGMALGVWDEIEAEIGGDRLVIEHHGPGADEVPLDETHLVHTAMATTWRALGQQTPRSLRLTYSGAIPHARGMGSSASAIVAGVAAATALAGHDLSQDEVLAFVNDVASSIEGHPDNASASVYGGVTVSWAGDGLAGDWRSARLTPHPQIMPMVIVPTIRLETATARAALPKDVPLATAARNSGRAALLAHALTERPDLLMPATVDFLHQEARRPAYPDAMALVDALRSAKVPAVISGAGPTVLALASARTAPTVLDIAGRAEVLTPGIPGHGVRAVSL